MNAREGCRDEAPEGATSGQEFGVKLAAKAALHRLEAESWQLGASSNIALYN